MMVVIKQLTLTNNSGECHLSTEKITLAKATEPLLHEELTIHKYQ